MKLGIIIYSTDAETVWNVFRLGAFALQQGDKVKVFLLAKGVEYESFHSLEFPVKAQMQTFVDDGGRILVCGTCLKLRHSGGTELCRVFTMQDLYDTVKESDKVLTVLMGANLDNQLALLGFAAFRHWAPGVTGLKVSGMRKPTPRDPQSALTHDRPADEKETSHHG